MVHIVYSMMSSYMYENEIFFLLISVNHYRSSPRVLYKVCAIRDDITCISHSLSGTVCDIKHQRNL